MSKARVLKGTLPAWCTSKSSVGSILNSETFPEWSVHYTNSDMRDQGWVQIGEASIELRIESEVSAIEQVAATLRKEIEKTKAEAHQQVIRLEDQLGKLLAIGFTSKEDEEPDDGLDF